MASSPCAYFIIEMYNLNSVRNKATHSEYNAAIKQKVFIGLVFDFR